MWLLWLGILLTSSSGSAESDPVCLELAKVRASVHSEVELLARLVLAEGISTRASETPGCDEADAFRKISWGVANRVRLAAADSKLAKRYGHGVRGVVFQRGQFPPAVSPRSRFSKYFACPTEAPEYRRRWRLSFDVARQAIEGRSEQNPLLANERERRENLSRISHFYYPRSEQATPKPPAWADPEGSSFVKEVSSDCLWFFRG